MASDQENESKAKTEAEQILVSGDPVALALQRIAAAQHQRNELLQTQRELNVRLEHVLAILVCIVLVEPNTPSILTIFLYFFLY